MDTLILSRLQFATTTVYHFFFVPLTLGLSTLLAIMETAYVRTGNETYKRMVKFWGKLFVINFALGVATGIVLEFQFGMNWSEYSRFVGDIFGAPLAIEALLAFFLESTFLGIWIFGWERLSKRVHLAAIWLVAIGSNLSALWILIANSFMHQPVGFRMNPALGRAEMTDFWALITNPHAWLQFPHVFTSGVTTAGVFVLGISAYHLLRKTEPGEIFQKSFRFSAIYGLVGVLLVIFIGHTQAQYMVQHQPMKMAAAEALWESADPAPLSVVAVFSQKQEKTYWALEIPRALSFLSYNSLEGKVEGIKELQQQFVDQHGPGYYIPPVLVAYWSFRFMVGSGFLMLFAIGYAIYLIARERAAQKRWFLRLVPWVLFLPYVANTNGWLLTEIGRQPWIVYNIQLTADGVSPNVTPGTVLFSLIGFGLVYAVLIVADIYLLAKHARKPEALGS
jgi:cytochrome d ubiquinol oxidase subunit I